MADPNAPNPFPVRSNEEEALLRVVLTDDVDGVKAAVANYAGKVNQPVDYTDPVGNHYNLTFADLAAHHLSRISDLTDEKMLMFKALLTPETNIASSELYRQHLQDAVVKLDDYKTRNIAPAEQARLSEFITLLEAKGVHVTEANVAKAREDHRDSSAVAALSAAQKREAGVVETPIVASVVTPATTPAVPVDNLPVFEPLFNPIAPAGKGNAGDKLPADLEIKTDRDGKVFFQDAEGNQYVPEEGEGAVVLRRRPQVATNNRFPGFNNTGFNNGHFDLPSRGLSPVALLMRRPACCLAAFC